MSKSWISMSRKMPPERSIYDTGGGAGSRLVMTSVSGLPISPSCSRRLSAAKLGSKRRLKPIMQGRPLAATSRAQARARSRLRSTGFSQNTALPCRTARSIRSAWVSVLVQISTASMAGSARMASICATRAPVLAASSAAARASTSAT